MRASGQLAEQAREAEAQAEAQAAQREAGRRGAGPCRRSLSLIRLSGAALGRGDTRKAARFRQSIEAALPNAPALPPHLARNLEQLDARLNQLRQWKDYAAAPKRIELIEDVEALIGVDEAPETLLEHLRALRQEWRTINKGLAVEATAEAERFEQAFTAAFQPCQVYLNEQAAIRRTNLDARKQVLERVLAFEAGLDAEHPDHPLIHARAARGTAGMARPRARRSRCRPPARCGILQRTGPAARQGHRLVCGQYRGQAGADRTRIAARDGCRTSPAPSTK